MTVTVHGFLEAQLDRLESDLAVTSAHIGRQAALRGEKGFVLWLMEGGGPATFQELHQTAVGCSWGRDHATQACACQTICTGSLTPYPGLSLVVSSGLA